MRTSNLRAVVAIGGMFILVSLLSFGCGNPEAPQIKNVRLSYWDTLTGDGSWVPLDNGGVAPQSPVRIQGNITDNTAVVSPRIVWFGERGDVDEGGFTECTEGTDEFHECELSCEEAQAGFYECNPLLPTRKLMRGDLFRLTLETSDGEQHELEVRVSEAQDLIIPEAETDPIQIVEDYRILRVVSLTDDPNPFLWALFQRKAAGGPWLPLRSGDVLALGSGDDVFQLAVETPEGVELGVPPTAAWRSLVKWNEDSFLNWDARTGDFEEVFQLFDPRDRQELSGDEGAPAYGFAVSAEDVPDQKTGVFRFSEVFRELVFSPVIETQPPDLEVDGEDEERIETSEPAENIVGRVENFNGEVRSLTFRLSDGPEGTWNRVFYYDPNLITLGGRFAATLVYVSDWEGDEVVDEPEEEEGGIPNSLEVVALDMQGNWKRTNLPIVFTPPSTGTDQVPELQVLEIFPALDKDQVAQLPFGEELRVRARSADDRGQPDLSGWECDCEGEEVLINADRCPCTLLGSGELNAGGEFPQNPWEWIVHVPASVTQESYAVLRATEKVDKEDDIPEAKFSAIAIDLEPDAEAGAFQVSVSLQESFGPNVVLVGLNNGDIVDPDGIVVEATMFPNITELNQIKALWNGEPRGTPTFDSEAASFRWDLQDETVKEGDRICMGAISVTGQATLYLLEFVDTAEGLLLGVTVTSDEQTCVQIP